MRYFASLLVGTALFCGACRKQADRSAPLADNPLVTESLAKEAARAKVWAEANGLTAQQAAQLQRHWRQHPDDLAALNKLLIFHTAKGSIETRRELILWLVKHHPDDDLAGSTQARISALTPENGDAAGYARAKKLWLAQAAGFKRSARVWNNAASFFAVDDPALAEKMLLQAQASAPDPNFSFRLGNFYYQTLVGSNASMPMGVVRSVDQERVNGPFAAEVRRKLAESNDATLLAITGGLLVTQGRSLYLQHNIDFDAAELGKTYLDRALVLDPSSVRAHASLLYLKQADRRNVPESQQDETLRTMSGTDRFFALARFAETAYIEGEMADYYKHDPVVAKKHWTRAKKDAEECLRAAPAFRANPDYGAAIYKANMTLGMVAMRNGDKTAAARFMLAAAKSPSCEELAYSDDYLTYKLAGQVLKYGQSDAVLEFLDTFSKTWVAQRRELLQSAAEIRRGVKPFWYPRS